MRRQLSQLALVALALAGCGAPPAPEGFTLAVQMMNVRPVAVDALRITFTPRDATPPVVFQPTPPQSYEDGAITVEVDGSGILSMVVTGDYVRAHSTMTGVDAHRFEVEIWSDDDAMRDGPRSAARSCAWANPSPRARRSSRGGRCRSARRHRSP